MELVMELAMVLASVKHLAASSFLHILSVQSIGWPSRPRAQLLQLHTARP